MISCFSNIVFFKAFTKPRYFSFNIKSYVYKRILQIRLGRLSTHASFNRWIYHISSPFTYSMEEQETSNCVALFCWSRMLFLGNNCLWDHLFRPITQVYMCLILIQFHYIMIIVKPHAILSIIQSIVNELNILKWGVILFRIAINKVWWFVITFQYNINLQIFLLEHYVCSGFKHWSPNWRFKTSVLQ